MGLEICLTNGGVALVDEQDYELVSQFRWARVLKGRVFYALQSSGATRDRMHRLILGFPDMGIDHRNNNGLDNRRENLRLCSQQQNLRNQRKRGGGTSHFKGVHFDSYTGRWRAGICVDYKTKWLGRFNSEIEAAKAYDNAAIRIFGDFARLNFEGGDYDISDTI